MSLSAMPSLRTASTTLVIAAAAASRAALAVGRSIITPRLIVAMSGMTVTLPLPATESVCSAGWSPAPFTTGYVRGAITAARVGPARRPTASAPTAAIDIQPAVERLRVGEASMVMSRSGPRRG